MKKILTLVLIAILVLSIFMGLFSSVAGEEKSNQSNRGNPRWNTYKTYYNKTFSMGKDWELDNVSVVVFVQTNDLVNKSASGGTYVFNSGEVLQSVVNDLDGKLVSTGTKRRVLSELFTSENCVFCPGADGAMDRITRDTNYYPSKMSLIEWHPNTGGFADIYGFPASDARINFYFGGHSSGYPTAIFDGVIEQVGGNADGNYTGLDPTYKNHINSRASQNTIVDIVTRGYKDTSSGWINVSVELLNPTPIRNLKVNFVVIEDVYPAMGGTAYLRYTARSVIPQADFTPPNHAPKIKTTLPNVDIYEDESDSNTIKLAGAFEDEDLDVLTFSSDRDGNSKQNIKVEIDETGNVTFTPDENWNGVEEITFYADDGKLTVEQKITVTVASVNDAPTVAHPMVDFTMYEDIPVENKFNLTYVFADVDMDPTLNANPQAPLDLSFSGDNHIDVTISNSGWVSFDPEPDWNGNETITFKAVDTGGIYATDDVRIWVRSDNDPPVLTKAFPNAEMNEDEILEDFIDLNEYYSDQDGDSLTYEAIEPDNIEVKFTYKTGSVFVKLTPEKNFWGTETVTIQATDIPGSTPVTGSFDVTVKSVNDPPILESIDEWDIISPSVTISDDVITVLEDSKVEIIVTAKDPADNDDITFSDDTELFDIDPVTGKIEFTPTNADVGQYEVEITVDDGQDIDNTDSYTYTVIVKNVNDPPENVKILMPEDGETYVEGTDIQFKGSAEDQDLEIQGSKEWLSYEWFADKISESLSFDKEFTRSFDAGEYKITLQVTDSTGAKEIAEITITVEIDTTIDTDKDGIPDTQDDDDDGDQIPDAWEIKYSTILNPLDASDAGKDPDNDGFTNLQEYLGTDGKPGGNDETNPRSKTSHPETKVDDKGSDGSEESTDSYLIYVVLGVIIVVVLLVLLFLFMRKRKKTEDVVTEPQTSQMPMPILEPTSTEAQMQMQMQMQQPQHPATISGLPMPTKPEHEHEYEQMPDSQQQIPPGPGQMMPMPMPSMPTTTQYPQLPAQQQQQPQQQQQAQQYQPQPQTQTQPLPYLEGSQEPSYNPQQKTQTQQ